MSEVDQRSDLQSEATADHTPLLSVTVLNYNYAHFLPQCLDSILRQTFTDFELLLINDCSTDNSLEVIQPYLADPRIILINHEQNRGYIASLIEGSERSRGTYLTVISADDLCASDRAFETLLGMLEAHPEATWAHSAFGVYGPDGSLGMVARHHEAPYVRAGFEEYPDLLLRRTYMLHSGVIIRASTYHAVGGYDAHTRYACDTRMWLTLCAQGSVAYSPEALFGYRRHESNMSDSRGGVRQGLREHIAAIDATFATMRSRPGITPHLYRQAMRKNLRGNAEDAIYAGRIRVGWYAIWCALRIHPVWTLAQRGIPVLFVRTLLGGRGFMALQSVISQARQRLARRVRLVGNTAPASHL